MVILKFYMVIMSASPDMIPYKIFFIFLLHLKRYYCKCKISARSLRSQKFLAPVGRSVFPLRSGPPPPHRHREQR